MSKVDSTESADFTPGPWTFDPRDISRLDHSRMIKGPSTYVAAALDFNNYARDAECEANARLIAAAPAMYAALDALVNLADQGLGEVDLEPEERAAVDAGHAALAAARGA